MLFRLFAAVVLSLITMPAAAMEIMIRVDTPGDPLPNRLHIAMSGEIVAGDAEKLRSALAMYDQISFREIVVYLDSPGGSLVAGLEMARVLKGRSEIVSTRVESTERTFAECASACVFVFAGGDLRYLAETGRIGVHQFFISNPDITSDMALSVGQSLSSDIVRLFDSQGIATDFFEEMAYTPSTGIKWVDRRKLEDWRVVTGDVLDESIEYINVNGQLSLRMAHDSIYGSNSVILTCNESNQIVAIATLDEPPGVAPAEIYAVIDGVAIAPENPGIIDREGYRTRVIFLLAPYQARLLAGATSFGVRVMDILGDGFWGFEQTIRTERVREMVNGCGGGNSVQPGVRMERGVDFLGEDLYTDGIRNVTLKTCVKTCQDDSRCVAVSFVEAQNWCWPKSSTIGRRLATGITSATMP